MGSMTKASGLKPVNPDNGFTSWKWSGKPLVWYDDILYRSYIGMRYRYDTSYRYYLGYDILWIHW